MNRPNLKHLLAGTRKSPKLISDLITALHENTVAVNVLHGQLLEMAQAAQQPKLAELPWPPMATERVQ